MLGKGAFQRSKQFVEAQARPLDVAYMRFHFDSAPAETLVKELLSFQNDDGGFASTMAPDLTDRESSPLGTSIAFQYMREVGQVHFEGIASKSVRYLKDTFDEGRGVWRIIPDSVEDTPHPPWFNRSGVEQTFGSFKLNPTAEILGYLYDYQDSLAESMTDTLSRNVLAHVGSLEEIEMHDFLCCKRLAETEKINPEFRAAMLWNLRRLLPTSVSTDASQWTGYGLWPLKVADRTDSPFYESLAEAVERNLDYVVATQEDDGSWAPTWNWGGQFPDDWEAQKGESAGWLTVDNLLALKEHGHIEGYSPEL